MARRVFILSVLVVLAAVAPASAQVVRPPDVLRIESAMGELGKQKNGAQGELNARERAAATARSATPTHAARRRSGRT